MARRSRGSGDGEPQASTIDPKYSLAEFVRERLRLSIETGEYSPGDRIRESDIAERLEVSRTPVREALRQLDADGLLVFEPWRGVIVAELCPQKIVELYKVRASLDGLAAGLAAQHMDESEIAVLERIVALADSVTEPERLAALNKQFHEMIYTASHNRYLVRSITNLRSPLALLRGTTYSINERSKEAQVEHRAILDAIRSRDSERAEQIARAHLKGAEVARLRLLAGVAEPLDQNRE